MCKRLMFLISLVFVLGIVTSAYADTYNWTNDYPWSTLWISPWNWDPATPYGGPTSGDQARIASGPMGPVVDTDATADEISGPARGGGGDQEMLLIKDCNLVVGFWELRGSEGDPSRGIITMADNAKVVTNGFRVHDERAKGIINMTDDTQFISTYDLRFGDQDEEYFELNMSGNAYLFVEDAGDQMRQNNGEFHIDLSENAVMDIARMRARGRSAGLHNTIVIRDNAQLICFDDYFRHTGGGSALTVDVLDNAILDVDGYIGFGEDNDNAADSTVNMSGQLIKGDGFRMVMDGDAKGFTTVNLTSGVIDTGYINASTDNWVVNICGDGVWIVDGDRVAQTLAEADAGHWVACPEEDCFGDISPRGNLMVDYNNVNPGRTTIWAELNVEAAWAPQPADGAVGVPSIGTELCWCTGESTEVSHLFLGTDEALVEARDPSTYQGPLHGVNCFDPGALQLCTTYYWVVDEQEYGIVITPGTVWSFTVECCRALEDFEAYTLAPNYIWDTWKDGCGDKDGLNGNGTGSCVNLSMDVLHGGAKAMTYTYENIQNSLWERDANYSEAVRTFDPALDLTLTGEVAMIAWFYGDSGNGLTSMSLELNGDTGAAAVYGDNGEDTADIQLEEWIDWNMELANFTGVDLTAVSTIGIVFGDKAGNVPDGAMGIMRFDDIEVCPVRCVPKFVDNIIDLNDDCLSDWLDVGLLVDNWLVDRR